MTKAKHSPGDWHYNLNVEKKKRKMVIYTDGSAIVAVIPSSRDDNKESTLETMKADAALIAAAPELLQELANNTAVMEQALKIVDAYRHASLGDGDISAMNIRSLIETNRALIAKAIGEA